MSIVAFSNQKGGVGKSSAAVHFAYWLAVRQKKTVQLIDSDPQKSSSYWLGAMDAGIKATILASPDDLLEQIPALASECDYLIVDGAAGLAEPTRAVLFRADLAVIPCQPTGLDLHSASDAVRLVKQAQSVRFGLPKAALFLSRAIKNTKLKSEAIELLRKLPEVTALKTIIHQRQAVADSFGQGATVWNLGKSGADAAKEYESLFKEILEVLS